MFRPARSFAARGLIGVAAIALLAACGGGSSSKAAPKSTTSTRSGVTSTTASPTSAPPTSTPKSARGVTGIAAIVAGKPDNSTGTGIPGVATSASLGTPSYVASAPDGSVYLVDNSKGRLLRVHDGQVTVAYAGDATARAIGGLAVSTTGKVVVLTPEGLLQITADGKSKSIATLVALGDGVGPGAQTPLAFDKAGNLYIGNSNRYKVVRRTPAGAMSVVAGNGVFTIGAPKGDGGAATAAPIGATTALVADAHGNLLIGQVGGAIRKVSAGGTLSTVGGAGETKLSNSDGTFAPDATLATHIAFAGVNALAIDTTGRIYVGDSTSSAIVRINLDGTVTFIAGDQQDTAEPSETSHPANQTRITDASGLAFDGTGALLVVEKSVLLRIEGVAAS